MITRATSFFRQRPMVIVRLAAAGLLALLLMTGLAHAQMQGPGVPVDTDQLRKVLDRVGKGLGNADVTDEELATFRSEVEPYVTSLGERIAVLSPQLAQVEARIAELKPAEGESVPSALEAEYRALGRSLEEFQAEINLNRSLLVEVNQTLSAIAAQRQRLFQSRILSRSNPLFTTAFYTDLQTHMPRAFTQVGERFAVWLKAIEGLSALKHAGIAVILLGVGVIAYALWNRLLSSRLLRLNQMSRPATTVFIHFLSMSLVLTLAVVAGNYVLRTAGYVPESFEGFLTAVSVTLGLSVAFLSLSKAVLDPHAETTLLLQASAPDRRRLHTLVAALLTLTLLHVILVSGLRMSGVDRAIVAFESLVVTLVAAGLFWRMGRALGQLDAGSNRLARLLKLLMALAGLAMPAAALLGYVSLANFIYSQVLWISFILVLSWLCVLWLGEQLGRDRSDDTRLRRLLANQFGFSAQAVEFICVMLQGLGRLVVVLAALLALALPWGGVGETLFARIANSLGGLDMGGLTLSPLDVIVGVLIFVVGLALVRLVKNWLSQSLLPLTRFDEGIQNSLSTFAGYVGFIVLVLVTLSYIGVELQNLALIAGALSVGIGFGLQSIVNNFVSGLILLAERPFKVGDWIVVGAEQGNVRRINVRSTEIETFDRASIIVPNADLITGVVKNWMHTNRTGRIIVTVGVSYDAEPEVVREILLKCAREHPEVLTYPAPNVFFQDFGDNALIFELYAFLGAVDKSLSTKSDLRFAIFRELKAAGIGIPFPQRDIHLKGEVQLNAEGRPVRFVPDDPGREGDA